MTRIFYLVLISVTLAAAAVQLPREGFPPDIDLGPEQANAQAPLAQGSGQAYPNTGFPGSFSAVGVPEARRGEPAGTTVRYDAPGALVPPPPLPINGPAAYQPPVQEMEGTKVLARVGGDVILAGEVISSVNSYLARNGINPNDPEVIAQREQLVRMRLQQLIVTRCVVHEARRKIPEEGYKKAMEQFDKSFYESVVPKMIADRKAADIRELEAQLRRDGTTLEREKRNFAESVLQNSWIEQTVKVNQEVTHEDMLRYYQQHAAEYELAAQSRWEQITMLFERFPSKNAAYAALAEAGNQVVDGRPFAEVARAVSQGATASQGGVCDWTKKGSLVSQPLENAVFTSPVGALSPIFEDDKGFHIVRVLERREAGRTPFLEAQVEIKKKINEQRTVEARQKFVDEVRKRTPVWTIYDDEKSTARTPADADAERYRK